MRRDYGISAVPVSLLGVGGVGRALVRQTIAARPLHASSRGLRLDVHLVRDSSGVFQDNRALADSDLLELLAHESAAVKLRDFPGGRITEAGVQEFVMEEAGEGRSLWIAPPVNRPPGL